MDRRRIRQATAADIDQLVSLLRYLFGIEEDFRFEAERQADGLRLLLDSPGAVVMAAADNGVVVGMATGQLLISTAEGGPSLLVEDLVVTPSFHGRGIGAALLDALTAWGRLHGAGRLQLLADRNNHHALLFYQKRGWRQTRLICLRRYADQ